MFNWNKKKEPINPSKHVLGKNHESDLELLINECNTYLKKYDRELVKKAFYWCYKTHKNKVRKSGHPYYTHPLEVALIVVREMPLDDVSVAVALLHNVVDEGDTFGLKDIQNEFGSTVAEIIENIVKIKFIENKTISKINDDTIELADELELAKLNSIQNQALENYRKLLLSLFTDVRIILVKLADRLHNMRTLEFLKPEKQKKMAEETIEVYCPFANRFGLGNIKWEMEDLAFKYFNRSAYEEIRDALQLTRQEREEYISNIVEPLKKFLKSHELIGKKGIKSEIFGRPKHIFSIYNKMNNRKLPMSKLYDLFAVRVIIDSEESHNCFLVYSLITELFKPVPNTFKDYISNPKSNGYQSIHFAIFGPDNRPVEIQIRTQSMHLIAEKGVAAHFQYKRGLIPAQSIMDQSKIRNWTAIVREIFEHSHDYDANELMETVKSNLLIDEIYVFTPDNEFRILPNNATPLDFAYLIHSDIGHHCVGAKVNSKIAPLDYKLESGDTVEILTSKNQKPTKNWLDIVITQKAKSQIIKFLKEENLHLSSIGKELWREVSNSVKYDAEQSEFLADINKLQFDNEDDFYIALGSGHFKFEFLEKFFSQRLNDRKHSKIVSRIKAGNHFDTKSINNELLIKNSNNEILKLANLNSDGIINRISRKSVKIAYSDCCLPLPGDDIVAEIASPTNINIHRKTCSSIITKININSNDKSDNKKELFLELGWEPLNPETLDCKIKIHTLEDSSLFSIVSMQLLNLPNVNLKGLNIDKNESGVEGIVHLTLDYNEEKHNINHIISVLKMTEGVKNAERC